MNLADRDNYEFVLNVLTGRHQKSYSMPKGAKFLVIDRGVIKATLEAEKVVGYYFDGESFFFDGNKKKCREVLRSQVQLVEPRVSDVFR